MSISMVLNLIGFVLMLVGLGLSLAGNHRAGFKVTLLAGACFVAAICMVGKEWP